MSLLRGVLGLLAVAALALPCAASAQEHQVQLALKPVDQPGSYFDIELRPGQVATLEVALINAGTSPIRARTYAADAYTIINGGFGARLRDEPASGTTLWLDYPTDVLEIAPGTTIERSFTVRVPEDAAAGEYITAILLENEEPLAGSGQVALDQIVRQAVAVVVTVPGPRTPALSVGGATHKVAADRSVVAVEVTNTGNVRLSPVAELVVRDQAGAEVVRSTIPMGTFYAGDSTLVEASLATLLPAGTYTVELSVEDSAQQAEAAAHSLPLLVEAEINESAPFVLPSLQHALEAARAGRVPLLYALLMLAAALVVGVLVGRLVIGLRRRSRGGSAKNVG